MISLGARYNGSAPMMLCIDFKPCDPCLADRKGKIMFVEVVLEGRMAISSVGKGRRKQNLFPTGRFALVPDSEEIRALLPALSPEHEYWVAYVDAETFGMFTKASEAA